MYLIFNAIYLFFTNGVPFTSSGVVFGVTFGVENKLNFGISSVKSISTVAGGICVVVLVEIVNALLREARGIGLDTEGPLGRDNLLETVVVAFR